ncbi:MAG TPA: NAD(P)/FAD-dependent oxidoreductase [Hyphomicrobium sp.]|nr:NAD(P)/FAD-dependent oxidoreductase [Hyphomicrobium sp.]
MGTQYDVIVIGAGLGGLTAAASLAQDGCRVLLVERNYGVGGAASTYKAGDLVVEASLHETASPEDPTDPKHDVLGKIGVRDKVVWVPTGSVYEARGGALGPAFVLPEGFDAARAALIDRFPQQRAGIIDLIHDMEHIATGLGTLSRGWAAFDNPLAGLTSIAKLLPVVTGWRRSVSDQLARTFGDDEAAKCAVAANLLYWHDDPDALWWVLFAVAQGGYIGSGGRFIQGGSQRLSNAIAKAMRNAGGELLLRRTVTEILFDARGQPVGVVHEGKQGGDRVEAHAPVIISGAAPSHMVGMLPPEKRDTFFAPYAATPLSISLFSVTFGMSRPAAHFGLSSYATMLLPEWMQTLADYKRGADVLADAPGEAMPPLAVVNYSAVDSGLGGPPYPVSVVGVDRISNWQKLDSQSYEAKRAAWGKALVAALDRTYPGFADAVETTVFNTASSIESYLGTPQGAVYGFAPLPPTGSIRHGWGRSPRTPIKGLLLASAYAGSGGYTGAILGGAMAARQALGALPVSEK